MNKSELIQDLKIRIKHNEQEVGMHEQKHGEYVAKYPKQICSVNSEMADWHKGKIAAYNYVIKMLEAAQ